MSQRKARAVLGIGILSVLTSTWVLSGGWEDGTSPSVLPSPPPLPAPPSRVVTPLAPNAKRESLANDVPIANRVDPSVTSLPADKYMHTGDLTHFTDGSGDTSHLVSDSVVLILYGGRFGGAYFLNYALPRMQAHFFRCFPYPLHIFYERGVTKEEMKRIRMMIPGSNVTFERISFDTLPEGVSEDDVDKWKSEGSQKKFQGRGYRMMCRFWAGAVWSFPSLQKYKQYMRFDTDSIIPTPVPQDPFKRFISSQCEYGYNKLKGENPFVTTRLWDTTVRWMESSSLVTKNIRNRVERAALKGGDYWGPMYYNNFELGTMSLKTGSLYQDYFSYVDSHKPYGIFRYRWGDAPLHTIGIAAALKEDSQYCAYTRKEFPYQHNPDKKQIKGMPIDATSVCSAV